MSENSTGIADSPGAADQLTDILLVLDKELKKIMAVKGINKNGELETVDPKNENENQFLRVDKNGDPFSNFFSNFISQLKHPTRFQFFRVPITAAMNVAKNLQEKLGNLLKEGEEINSPYKVKSTAVKEVAGENKTGQNQGKETSIQHPSSQNQDTMETTQNTPQNGEPRFKAEQVDWETLSNLGLSKEKLEKLGVLNDLLKGYKTNVLVPVSLNLGTAITRLDARLSLQPGENNTAVMAIHGIRKEPSLHFPFFGHEFSDEDKQNLLATGNMGRIVNLTNSKTGEAIPSIISVDKLTNELVALRTERIKIPDEIKGIKLDEQQKQTLSEGKPLYLEDMVSTKGDLFNAHVQFNADKCYVEFLFNEKAKLFLNKTPEGEVPKVLRGKELSPEQQSELKEGKTIYLAGLEDKKGQPYNGYFTLNKETGKIDFSFSAPSKLKEKIQPAEAHKTQVAVNSEGKTNEATKKLKEPLKKGQTTPTAAQKTQQKQRKQGGRKVG